MKRISNLSTTVAGMLVLSALVGCSQGAPESDWSLSQGSTAGVAMADSACSLLDRNEIGVTLGAGVAEGKVWGVGSVGCEWVVGDGSVVRLVVVEDSQYWQDLAGADGGEALPAIGQRAFVAPWLGAFRAGVLTTVGCIYVMTPRRGASVRLLRAAAGRLTARDRFRKA